MSKKIKVTKSQQKVVEFKRRGNIAFSLFLTSQSWKTSMITWATHLHQHHTVSAHLVVHWPNLTDRNPCTIYWKCRKCSLCPKERHAYNPWWSPNTWRMYNSILAKSAQRCLTWCQLIVILFSAKIFITSILWRQVNEADKAWAQNLSLEVLKEASRLEEIPL